MSTKIYKIEVNRFQHIYETKNRTLKNKTRRETNLKFYKKMSVPVLLYGNQSWISTQRDKSNIQSAELRFLRRVKGCTRRSHIRN